MNIGGKGATVPALEGNGASGVQGILLQMSYGLFISNISIEAKL